MKSARLAVLVLAGLSLTSVPALAGKPSGSGLPNSMAAIGDSITQAANLDGSNIGASNPEHSWSTGYDGGDIVVSHYERLLAKNRKINGKNYNDSVSGSRMNDAPGQAQQAVAQGVQYVTIEMGGNDVCTSDWTNMTSVSTYETYFRQTMDILTSGLPNVKVYVLSVPDVYQLWSLFDGEWYPEWIWSTFDVCQSMLDNANTEADRQYVRQRNIDFNAVLATVCAQYTQCKFDGNAIFNYQFARSDVSGVDYFHPSMNGQKNIAQGSWQVGYWPTV
jgi:lysophospholipase L1-like esterase